MDDLVLLKKGDLADLIDTAITKALARNKPAEQVRKNTLSLDEAVDYLNENGFPVAKSTIYKLTSTNQIPFHRFGGRKIVFRTDELDEWAGEQLIPENNSVCHNVARSARRKM